MIIEKNKVVSFHYKLSELDETLIEDSSKLEPAVFLYGHKGMLLGVEDALSGKQTGDKVLVTLEPKDAYGEIREDAIQRVPMKHVAQQGKKKTKFKPGMIVRMNTANGLVDVMVVKVGLKTLDVDTNHPLAGKTLTFDMEVVDVREASQEEIAHGHVHGEGGHHH